MAIETHIRAILAADSAVNSIVGADSDLVEGGKVLSDELDTIEADDESGDLISDSSVASDARIYFTDIKQGTLFPAVSMFQVSGNRTHTLAGPDGFISIRMQIDCWGKSLTDARTLWDAVRLALDGYRGKLSGDSIASITMTGERIFFEPDPKLHRISCDAMIWHREKLKIA